MAIQGWAVMERQLGIRVSCTLNRLTCLTVANISGENTPPSLPGRQRRDTLVL